MNYLLVGNGPVSDLPAATKNADVIIQINDCKYAAEIPPARIHHIFLLNTGIEVSHKLVDRLCEKRQHLPRARVMLARNPLFHRLKGSLLPKHRRYNFKTTDAWKRLPDTWQLERVSCLANLRLDIKLIKLGMPPSFMPSTGMIAYDWVSRRMYQGDSLAIEGFTFEGWEQHPWAVERQLIKPIKLPFSWEADQEPVSGTQPDR